MSGVPHQRPKLVVERKAGAGLPRFVNDEFEAFLKFVILAHGFLHLRCADCAHERLVGFSRKWRGIFPACRARRMKEMATHLVDHVITHGQWYAIFGLIFQ